VFLKTHRVFKDGKRHIYYSLCESLRVSRKRVLQRQVLHLGELNTTQLESWQRTIEVVEEDGRRHQMRLFTDRHKEVVAAGAPGDVAEVVLSSLVVRRPRQFGACWLGCKLWQELELDEFWQRVLGEEVGAVPWEKVVELLAVNRLIAPRSELSIHEKWFPQTAMAALLDSDQRVAEKDRLYRALDRMVEHKEALEEHLAQRWKDLFGASFEVLLYDLTSTYFEGEAEEVDKAEHGYSRDHRPDCKQLILALVVTPEGFPLSYEVFDGNRADVSTLEEVLEAVECKHGLARWGMGNSPSTRSFVAISHIPEFVLPKALLAPDVPGSRFRDQIARNVLRRKGRGALLPTACIANACRARANIRDAHG